MEVVHRLMPNSDVTIKLYTMSDALQLSVFHNLKLSNCRKQSKNQSCHIWSKMLHEHQTEYMRGKRFNYIIFQTKRMKMWQNNAF